MWCARRMNDNTGQRITDVAVLDRVAETGSIVVRRGPVESLDYLTWRRELRRAAKQRGIRIHTHQAGDGLVVVSDPDHIVDPQRLRAAVNSVSVSSMLDPG